MGPVTIYGRMSCGFCTAAISLCERKGYEYKFVDMMAEGLSKQDLSRSLGQPVHTVPQIVVGREYIGGYDQFARYVMDQASAGAVG